MSERTRIFTDIDYEKNGKQVNWLRLPYSVNRSAYGNISIPIAVFRNGRGPTVLLMAGTHGDEYEGQIALCRLIRALEPGQVSGRIIILPAANLPAALAGTRVSPLDQGNLNRVFPGDLDGPPTAAIAHYIDSFLFPLCDFCQDLHAGGASLDYLPFASMRRTGDPKLDERTFAALKAFSPSIGMIWADEAGVGYAIRHAIDRGLVALGGEFGSGGGVTISGVRMVERGIRNLLYHAGVMEVPGNSGAASEHETEMRLMEVRDRDYYVLAPDAGLFEPAIELGDIVVAGQVAGHVHFVDAPVREPTPAYFQTGGLVICKRHLARVERGDCVAHIATDYQS